MRVLIYHFNHHQKNEFDLFLIKYSIKYFVLQCPKDTKSIHKSQQHFFQKRTQTQLDHVIKPGTNSKQKKLKEKQVLSFLRIF